VGGDVAVGHDRRRGEARAQGRRDDKSVDPLAGEVAAEAAGGALTGGGQAHLDGRVGVHASLGAVRRLGVADEDEAVDHALIVSHGSAVRPARRDRRVLDMVGR